MNEKIALELTPEQLWVIRSALTQFSFEHQRKMSECEKSEDAVWNWKLADIADDVVLDVIPRGVCKRPSL